MEFSGVLKKWQVYFAGVNYKSMEFPGAIKKKLCGFFRGLGFKFPSLEFPEVK